MRHIDREALILELAAGRRVLHLGSVGFHARNVGDPIQKYRENLHSRIQAVASSIVGVDTNAEVIGAYNEAGLETGMVVGSVEHLEQLDLGEPFDVIFSGNVIEHLSNPGMMLDGMRALSHSGTALLITTPHALGLRKYLSHVRGRFRESDDHVMTFNGPSLANMIERHGFRVLSVDVGHENLTEISFKGRVAHAVIGRVPRFGRTLVVQAELP
jgi:hypothetical protein